MPDIVSLLENAPTGLHISRDRISRSCCAARHCGCAMPALEDDVEDALRDLAGELGMTRNDMIRFIVREWMEKNTYLPVHVLDEDGDVDGSA